ncbi:hypothetical protein [Helicobacter sp. T3_23-1056]
MAIHKKILSYLRTSEVSQKFKTQTEIFRAHALQYDKETFVIASKCDFVKSSICVAIHILI